MKVKNLNIKKYNSRNNKENITNVTNEAFRESEEFKNNVNEKLNSENKVLVRDFQMLERQYEDTEVRSTTKDVITVVSSVQAGDFEARTGQDLTYLLSLEEWEEYYKKNLKFLSEKLGKNAHCVYAVIHFDESTPHLHSAWTFAEENKKENNEINYAKIDKALRNNFSNKNKKEMKLKAGTKEYKEALAKYKEENMQKQIDKQLKKMQSRTSQKAFKCETGTSAINREFYRSINEEFKEKMKNEKVIQKLKKRIELFSNENCEIVKQRSEKYNNFETLDRAKHSMKTELEILADKINKNDYTEQELKRFKMINAKRILVEEKKAITIHDFKKKFKETKAKCRSIENNRTIAVGWNIINFKKNISNIIENNKKKKQLVNHFKEELKVLNNLKDTVNLKEIQEIIEKSTQGESAKDLINEKEQLKREVQDTKNEIYELNKRIMEKSRYDDKLNGQIYNKQLALGELSARVEEKRKEAEKPVAVSRERIRELEQEARQEARQRIERENVQKVKELEELKRNIEQQRQVQQMNEISIANYKKKIDEAKKESEEIEKKIGEKRNLSIEKLAEKSLKNAPVRSFEIDDYIEKNQEKFKNLLEEREAEIENEIVENLREDTREAFSVFQNFVREYARKNVYKDLINFKEAKRLTIQAFKEIQATSQNFFADFVENFKNKVNDLITKRQNGEKRPYTQENGIRQGKTR
ncbi:putative plasmid recombination enzyme (plasmid) [Leptotrichia wadei]|uniref:Putative plasmid recombination enzyme n=1 Tax=Leptotrichia wadei TaxID=157687 RepID=A0A510KZ43_9FUSO|nr:putative plasmid recombination enzyme [Leptotrichia wadei]